MVQLCESIIISIGSFAPNFQGTITCPSLGKRKIIDSTCLLKGDTLVPRRVIFSFLNLTPDDLEILTKPFQNPWRDGHRVAQPMKNRTIFFWFTCKRHVSNWVAVHIESMGLVYLSTYIYHQHPPFMWVFPKIRGTPKWMVYNGKPY